MYNKVIQIFLVGKLILERVATIYTRGQTGEYAIKQKIQKCLSDETQAHIDWTFSIFLGVNIY